MIPQKGREYGDLAGGQGERWVCDTAPDEEGDENSEFNFTQLYLEDGLLEAWDALGERVDAERRKRNSSIRVDGVRNKEESILGKRTKQAVPASVTSSGAQTTEGALPVSDGNLKASVHMTARSGLSNTEIDTVTRLGASACTDNNMETALVANKRSVHRVATPPSDSTRPAALSEVQGGGISKVETSLDKLFSSWGLDPDLRQYYFKSLGISDLYPWQAECLGEDGVAEGWKDLVYSAPTSGGKTMVAELIMLLRVTGARGHGCGRSRSMTKWDRGVDRRGSMGANIFEGHDAVACHRRAILVVPFISMVMEKVAHFQRVVALYNRRRPKRQRIKVKGLYGSKGGGGLKGNMVIIVCTPEKGNAVFNRLQGAGGLHEVVCLVVDEMHMVGDYGRGHTLELLLTKVRHMNRGLSSFRSRAFDPRGKDNHSTRDMAARTCSSVPQDDNAISKGSGLRESLCKSQQSLSFSLSLSPSQSQDEDQLQGQGPWKRSRIQNERDETGGNLSCMEGEVRIQVVGMSATLSNTNELAGWLGATLKESDFRPVPLDERVLVEGVLLDKEGDVVRKIPHKADAITDPDNVVTLCRESCLANDQVIIFCTSRRFAQNCASKVAQHMKVPAPQNIVAKREALGVKLKKEIALGMDPILQATIPSGVAFHHAGLTDLERSAIEGAFREGTLSVLAATSTLGAGVNLPAGRVIMRGLFGLTGASYKQMSGRAGRKGLGRDRGEAIIVVSNKGQAARAASLISSGLEAVESVLAPSKDGGRALASLVLEGVSSGVVKNERDLEEYVGSTLLWHQCEDAHRGGRSGGRRGHRLHREDILNHAWATLTLLIDQECVEVIHGGGRPPQVPASTGGGKSGGARCGEGPAGKDVGGRGASSTSLKLARAYHAWGHERQGQGQGQKHGQKGEQGLQPAVLEVTGRVGESGHEGQGVMGMKQYVQDSETAVVGCGSMASRPVSNAVHLGAHGEAALGNPADEGPSLRPTKLGHAVFRSSMGPGDGLAVFEDLIEGAKGLVVRHSLHLSYLLTHPNPPAGLQPDWDKLYKLYTKAIQAAEQDPMGQAADLVRVFTRVGISQGNLHSWASRPPSSVAGGGDLLTKEAVEAAGEARRKGRGISGRAGGGYWKARTSAQKAVRLVAAMAMRDLSNGKTLGEVSSIYGMSRGEVQWLRQSNATFAGMVTTFLKELGWTMFLKLVKGYSIAHTIGVKPKLLPLMQVPGMMKREAEALYESGIVNLMAMLNAPSEKVANILRLKTRFQITDSRGGRGQEGKSSGGAGGERQHFNRRLSRCMPDCATLVDNLDREKERTVKTARLQKAFNKVVRGVGGGSKTKKELKKGASALDLVSRAQPKNSFRGLGVKHARSEHTCSIDESGYATGSSDGINGSSGGTDTSGGGDSSEEEDPMITLMRNRALEDEDEDEGGDEDEGEDGDEGEDEDGDEGEGDGEDDDGRAGCGLGEETMNLAPLHCAPRGTSLYWTKPTVRTRGQVPPLREGGEKTGSSFKGRQGLGEYGRLLSGKSAGGGKVARPGIRARAGAGAREDDAQCTVGVKRLSLGQLVSDRELSEAKAVAGGWGVGRWKGLFQTPTPSKTRPSPGSSSFLYEPGISPGLEGLPSQDTVGAAHEACLSGERWGQGQVAGHVEGGREDGGMEKHDTRKNSVFALGASEMREFSSQLRLAKCFSFVLTCRPVTFAAPSPASRWDKDKDGEMFSREHLERTQGLWGSLTGPVPGLRFEVASAGSSYVPCWQEGSEGPCVISGVAFSFNGRTAIYLPLPPLLPPRPMSWRQHSSDIGRQPQALDGGSRPFVRWSGNSGGGVGHTAAFPSTAVAAVTLFVGFPWLQAGWNSSQYQRKRHRKEGSRQFSNPCLAVSRMWNAVGVEELNKCTRSEPTGRWALFREAVENPLSTKVCLDMKAVLVCLFGLGIMPAGVLEDPSVAAWLVDPSPDTELPESAAPVDSWGKKRRIAKALNPRVDNPNTSLLLPREPTSFIDLACMQASATLKMMAQKEKALKDLTLTLPFHHIEMPAIVSAAWIEYCGVLVRLVRLLDQKREVTRRLKDLRGIAEELAVGTAEIKDGGAALLNSSNRVHDTIYVTLGLKPPVSWAQRGMSVGGRPRARKQAQLGPTDTASLKEMLALKETSRGVREKKGPSVRVGRWPHQSFALDGNCPVLVLSFPTVALSNTEGQGTDPCDCSLFPILNTILQLSFPKHVQCEDPHGFVSAVVQHRSLQPINDKLGKLLRSQKWHCHLGGSRLHTTLDTFTSTGRMVTSNPPLQMLDHKIVFRRSWRTSLAVELEAGCAPKCLPHLWAAQSAKVGQRHGHAQREGDGQTHREGFGNDVEGPLSEEEWMELRVMVVNANGNKDEAPSMTFGYAVGVVEDRCVDDPVWTPNHGHYNTVHRSRNNDDVAVASDLSQGAGDTLPPPEGTMATFWRQRGFLYTPEEARSTKQILVQLGSSDRVGGKVYSYPADKVFRVDASFLCEAVPTSISPDVAARNPWFGREVFLKPRDVLAAAPGFAFVSADYSQVELRLMAHLSGDPALIQVLSNGGDIFLNVSSKMLGKSVEEVTDEERAQAKTVVYGILYGQSVNALAHQLGKRIDVASKIRNSVLLSYPLLQTLITRVKEECRVCGYVETLLGRRRYLPKINSEDGQERARAERQAVNSVCQGSAADLLKLATTNIAARLTRCYWMHPQGASHAANSSSSGHRLPHATPGPGGEGEHGGGLVAPGRGTNEEDTNLFVGDGGRSALVRNPPCRLVLTIHDELLYEVKEEFVMEVVSIVQECMENAVSLKVPLCVEAKTGQFWGSMERCQFAVDSLGTTPHGGK
ncbi:unnamed protein product [Discosporangium mesarthrocarpum]